jgi:BirA family transcriptional regulator, biotin operon repressor / biotin---[acetyl-CoA-carboxylase] ligase
LPWPAGVGRCVLATVDSTQAEALRRCEVQGAPLWVLAGEQTAGRGRRARPWASPRGNFHASLVLRPSEAAEVVALRSFVAALALRDSFVALTGLPQAFALKWPNDVLLNGGKVAGILLEAASATTGAKGAIGTLCIGIGVNLIAAPDPALLEDGALRPVSLLAETGLRIAPETFLDTLAPSYAGWEARLVQGGFRAVREAWLDHAARLGEPIRARTGTQTREGIFESIDAAGNLILRGSEGTVAIAAAEVFF